MHSYLECCPIEVITTGSPVLKVDPIIQKGERDTR